METPEKSAIEDKRPSNKRTRPTHPDVRKQQLSDLWILVATVRLACALTVATFFQPDEYFQSLEPAWRLVFGKDGGAWITWEWHHQLRSSLHPFFIAAVYSIAQAFTWLIAFPLSLRAQVLILAPRLAHGVALAAMDYHVWLLSERLFGIRSQESYIALALSLFSPWQWFAGARSLTNGLEATLTTVALYYWPWSWMQDYAEKTTRKAALDSIPLSVIFAAVAVILRPTNGIIWAVITIFTALSASQEELMHLVQSISVYGTTVLAGSYGLDRLFYGEWTFPPARFLGFNVVQNLAVFYGVNRPDYYFTEGLPLLLMVMLPFAVAGVYQAVLGRLISYKDDGRTEASKPHAEGPHPNESTRDRRFQALVAIVVAMVCALSLIGHKEVRFLYPLFPVLVVLAAPMFNRFFNFSPFPHPFIAFKKLLLAIAIILSIIIAFYISYIHQRGPLTVLEYLRSQFIAVNADALILGTRNAGPSSLVTFIGGVIAKFKGAERARAHDLHSISAAFLMPCHSTPWRSHLVYPEIKAWALTCEPPIGLSKSERDNYLDEADQFYANPRQWLRVNMEPMPTTSKPWIDNGWDRRDGFANGTANASSAEVFMKMGKRPWPRYVAFFEQLEPIIKDVIGGENSRYEECWRGFNTHWHDDTRRQGDIIVWCVDGSVDEDAEIARLLGRRESKRSQKH